MIIDKKESYCLKYLNYSKTFIKRSNDMDDIYENIEECNLNKKQKILLVFDNMIVDVVSDEKRNSIVTELFIRGRKLNISLALIAQP